MGLYYSVPTQEAYIDLMAESQRKGFEIINGNSPTYYIVCENTWLNFKEDTVVYINFNINSERRVSFTNKWSLKTYEGITNIPIWNIGDVIKYENAENDYMSTNEFIRKIKFKGYEIDKHYYKGDDETWIRVNYKSKQDKIVTICEVCENVYLKLDVVLNGWDNIDDEEKLKLYNIIDCYVRTPIEER